jgi:protein TonB
VDGRAFRLLQRAVLCSLALHAIALLCLAALRDGSPVQAPAPPPLTAHLAKPKPPPEPPKAEPPPPPPVHRAARPQPQPQAAAAPVPAPPAAVLSMEAAKTPAEPAFVVPVSPPPARVETSPTLAASSGPDPGSVARFRLELMEIARRYKRYPRIAQDNNWEGRVELRIAFAESGAISSITVKKGAGRAVLDEEAQAMIRAAQPQATIPPSLRGKAFTLEIPVDFFLREDAR